MSIEVFCGRCGKGFAASDKLAGRRLNCPACGAALNVPGPSGARATIAPARPAPSPPSSASRLADLFDEEFSGVQPSPQPAPRSSVAPRPEPFVPSSRRAPPKGRKRQSENWFYRYLKNRLFIGLAGTVLAVIMLVGSLLRDMSTVVVGEPPPPIDPTTLPDRGPMRTLLPGVEFTELRLNVPSGVAGHEDRLYVYLPPGHHEPRSLPCVLIAPGGSNMLCGIGLGADDQPEHTPYVLAGFAVVAYELDGALPKHDDVTAAQLRPAMKQFGAAQAGLVNARNALDFIAHKMPEIDPERIYAAGHSSAATMALMLAQHEPRIKGCVAYAPWCDPEAHYRSENLRVRLNLPGAFSLLAQWSPRRHEEKIHCPVFLFHARDDSDIPFHETTEFAERLRRLGKRVTFEAVNFGDHYDSMIGQGIPQGVAWLAALAGMPLRAPVAVPAEAAPPTPEIDARSPPITGIPLLPSADDGDVTDSIGEEMDRRWKEAQQEMEQRREESQREMDRRWEERRKEAEQRMEESRRKMEETRREMEERHRRMRGRSSRSR